MQFAIDFWVRSHTDRLRELWPFAVVAAAGSVVFAWLCDAVGDHDGITAIDGPVTAWFAQHRTAAEGAIGLLAARVTSPAFLVIAVSLAAAFVWVKGRRADAVTLAGATVIAYAAGAVAKHAEHRARPLSPVNLAPEGEPSFPSGHVLVVATIALVVLGMAWAQLEGVGRVASAGGALLVLLLISIDRFVVGAHWMTDVVGALALAAVVATTALAARRWAGSPQV